MGICCFAGHSLLTDTETHSKIKRVAENLILNHGVSEFLVGGYGDFDAYARKVIIELRENYPIKLIYVIPYLSALRKELKQWYEHCFDETMLADIPESTPMKYRIIKANHFMVNHADFLICYVRYEWGGAWNTLQYAKRKKSIKIYNIAEI